MRAENQSLDGVSKYLNGSFEKISGWCIPQLWNVIQPIHEFQEKIGCRQPVAEIGVFHGKFLIGLIHTKRSYGKHLAIYVFDLQQFNLDGAGKGSLEKLRENIKLAEIDDGEVYFKRADSMALTIEEISEIRKLSNGGFSMFSVDGCHMVEHTINDFRIAMQLTCPEGVIFVDDYLNMDWPGVHEGMVKLFLTDNPRFVPLAYLGNKLILCHISYHSDFLRHVMSFLNEFYPAQRKKQVRRFGYDSINVHANYSKKDYISQRTVKS